MQHLLLSLPTLGERRLLLKELDGHAELAADPGDPGSADRLLARLLAEPSGARVEVSELLAVLRDRVCAALFQREFGGRIDSQAHCAACGEDYAFGFDLASVLATQDGAAAATGVSLDASGRFAPDEDDGADDGADGGAWVRPPTIGDIAEHEDPDALSAALCGGTMTRDRVEALLDDAAPLLALDLETRCAQCDHPQVLRFDMVAYFLESLAAERPLLVRETHLIASRYGWGHDTIMSLTRGDRRAYASLILGERSASGLRRAG